LWSITSLREVEVLVVGASLAGLCAAYSAARAGAETLLIEVGARPNPATLLMEPLWRRTGLPVPLEAVELELLVLRLGGPSGQGPLFRFRVLHLNCQVFDRIFAERAAEAATSVHSGVRVSLSRYTMEVLTPLLTPLRALHAETSGNHQQGNRLR